MKEYERKHLLSKPAGPSEVPQEIRLGCWNNSSSGFCGCGPDDYAICDICGTKHMAPSPDGPSLLRMYFLGLEGFEECCGRLLDIIYYESGERFFEAYLAEFAANPTDPRFYVVIDLLQRRLAEALETVKQVTQGVKNAQGQVTQLQEQK